METFAEARKLISNPHFAEQKRDSMASLNYDMIDSPIVALIKEVNSRPYCFTVQCCYGHFLYLDQADPHNLDLLPITDTIEQVEYRIAYVCFCIDESAAGKILLEKLKQIPSLDPSNIQLCSAEWFWNRQVNTYALQVEPERFKHQDTAILEYKEAIVVENIRNEFFRRLYLLFHSLN